MSNKINIQIAEIDGLLRAMHDGAPVGNGGFSPGLKAKNADNTTPPVPSWTDPGTTWAYWGNDDKLPTTMREKVARVPIAGATLDKKIRMMEGNGLVYFRNEDMRNGPQVQRAYVQQVEDFLEENRIHTEWFPAQCADYCLPFNCFSELILSNNKQQITGLYHISAEHARLSKANTRTNQVDWLIYSYHFPFGTAQADINRVAMPLYRWYDREAFFSNLRGRKFGWHTRFPSPGTIYYAWPWWLGLFRENGWLDVSSQVPQIVSAMQKNQIALKYIIAIPESYFIIRHPSWMTYTHVERRKVIDDLVDEINDNLTGVDNVFKSINYVFKENEVNGQAFGKIEITAIDDKAKTGTWVPDSYAADAQIVQGFGMDPSQIGLAPEGGKMGAGSGSDKRESYNLMITLNTPDQRRILEPLNFISRYNGWGVTFMVDHTSHTTTNLNESGLQPSPQTTTIIPPQ